MQYTRKQFLMGTDVIITIISDTNPLEDIYNCFGIFYGFEKEFSRFIKTSDLSALNLKKELEVSDRFIEISNLSKQIYLDTNGFFNPLVNLKNIGYSEDFKKGVFEKKEEEIDVDIEKISIIGNYINLGSEQKLDLGGIVKGYSVDEVVKYLKEKGYKDFLINAGGDIYICGNNLSGKSSIVGIDNPFDKEKIFATLELKNKSISTSGIYKRKWKINDKHFHHIINPNTSDDDNEKHNEIISISLIADKCYLSDAYATSCIVMGIEKSLVFLKQYKIEGIIIGSDGNVYNTKGMDNYNLKIF